MTLMGPFQRGIFYDSIILCQKTKTRLVPCLTRENAGVHGHRVGVRPGPTVRCLAVLPDLADVAWTSLARRRDFWANKLPLARDG